VTTVKANEPKQQLGKTSTKKRAAKQAEKEESVSSKTQDRALDRHTSKHCLEQGCLNKLIAGRNWAIHTFREHSNKTPDEI
jgi:hypothetical protein